MSAPAPSLNELTLRLVEHFRPRWLTPDGNTPSLGLRAVETALRLLSEYHRYQAVDIDKVPTSGPALIVCTHSLATYDTFLLGLAIRDVLGRQTRGLADHLFFSYQRLGRAAAEAGMVEGTPERARSLLRAGELVIVAPGGMREALRSSAQKYEVSWARRRGFVRLALQTGTPIVPAACPAADDIFEVHQNRVTEIAYRQLRLPIPLFSGLGPTPLPRPVRLTHVVGDPIPVPRREHFDDADVEHLYSLVRRRMQTLIASVLSNGG